MNRHPLNSIADDDVVTYARDGAVCLRQFLNRDWVEMLEPIARAVRRDRAKYGGSPLREAYGKGLPARKMRFFFCEVFAKSPRSTRPTIWHSYRAGWPVSGQMVRPMRTPRTRSLGPAASKARFGDQLERAGGGTQLAPEELLADNRRGS
jgi:hypothetical protein